MDVASVTPAPRPRRTSRPELFKKKLRYHPLLAGECHYCRRKIINKGNLRRHIDACGALHMARGIDLLIAIAVRQAAFDELVEIAGEMPEAV